MIGQNLILEGGLVEYQFEIGQCQRGIPLINQFCKFRFYYRYDQILVEIGRKKAYDFEITSHVNRKQFGDSL